MKVAVVGAGRLGRSVAGLLARAGVDVALVRRGDDLPACTIAWLCVRDDDVVGLAASLEPGPIVLHSAGSLGPDVLAPHVERAVLHPLMSFPGPETGLPVSPVPASVEGSTVAVAAAEELCRILGWTAFRVAGDRRRYHAAACLASGHLAALFLDAADLLAEAAREGGAPLTPTEARALLLPLAAGSLKLAAEAGDSAITGPAVRGDDATVAAHRAALPAPLRGAYDALDARISARRRADPRE
jgi:predicted short-subunit dehydrogenase-like oxidoreductase (DUF2520 family)